MTAYSHVYRDNVIAEYKNAYRAAWGKSVTVRSSGGGWYQVYEEDDPARPNNGKSLRIGDLETATQELRSL